MTYSEIRARVFAALDLPSATTGDLLTSINYHIFDEVLDLASLLRPRELLTETASVTIDVTDVNDSGDGLVALSAFSITDFLEIAGVTVDFQDATERFDLKWKFVSFESWLDRQTTTYGDERGPGVWTLDTDDNIVLSQAPEGAEEWKVRVFYYAMPSAISDGTSPPFAKEFHQLVPKSVALQFPHMFQGDRASLLAKLQGDYNQKLLRLMKRRAPAKTDLRMRPTSMRTLRGGVRWPDFQTS